MKKLGTLKRLSAREVWEDEARGFTPWLEQNIDLLASVLDRDIEIEEREAQVGSFRADLVARDLTSGSRIIIENQFGATDHDHLGKVLTYASARDASLVVWIAEEFRDEHRSVMDWLNDKTGKDTAFFGAEIEVLQINGSDPAPNLKLVASPNWWKREAEGEKRLTPVQRAYQEFWSDFLTRIKKREPDFTRARIAPIGSWFNFGARRAGFYYVISFTIDRKFFVALDIDTGDRDENRNALEALAAHREMVEQQVGSELMWEGPTERRRRARISTEHDQGDIRLPQEQLDELKEWGIDMALRFRLAFSSHVLALEL